MPAALDRHAAKRRLAMTGRSFAGWYQSITMTVAPVTTPPSGPPHRFSIKPAVIAGLFAALCTTPVAFSNDVGVLLIYVFVGLPLLICLGIALLIAACFLPGKLRLSALAALPVVVAAHVGMLWLGVVDGDHIKDDVRWALWSEQYKEQVRTHPGPGAGLPHIDWDGWGMAGQDTSVYLVHDASDTMLAPPYRSRDGKVAGVPCPVATIHRLEPGWYVVMPYTNTDWDQCGDN